MRMQIASRRSMFQSHQIAVTNQLDRIGAVPERCRFVKLLHKPAIITILVGVRRDLLLLSPNSSWIKMHMGMQISTTSYAIFQRQ